MLTSINEYSNSWRLNQTNMNSSIRIKFLYSYRRDIREKRVQQSTSPQSNSMSRWLVGSAVMLPQAIMILQRSTARNLLNCAARASRDFN